jgi:hypothetical protein
VDTVEALDEPGKVLNATAEMDSQSSPSMMIRTSYTGKPWRTPTALNESNRSGLRTARKSPHHTAVMLAQKMQIMKKQFLLQSLANEGQDLPTVADTRNRDALFRLESGERSQDDRISSNFVLKHVHKKRVATKRDSSLLTQTSLFKTPNQKSTPAGSLRPLPSDFMRQVVEPAVYKRDRTVRDASLISPSQLPLGVLLSDPKARATGNTFNKAQTPNSQSTSQMALKVQGPIHLNQSHLVKHFEVSQPQI